MLLERLRLFAAVSALASAPVLAASAQTTVPPPPNAAPSARQAVEVPKPGAATKPADPAQHPLLGLAVFSSDGNKVGAVESIDAQPDGKITAINVKIGGFLGFGARVVAVPDGKFERVGTVVRVGLTAEEIGKLPALRDQTWGPDLSRRAAQARPGLST